MKNSSVIKNQTVKRHWLKNRFILLISSNYQSIIGQYSYFASTRQVFFCLLKDSN